MWLPETAVDLATLAAARRRGHRGDDPRAVAGGRRGARHPAAVPGGRRRRPARHRRVLRRRPVGRGLVRAGRDRATRTGSRASAIARRASAAPRAGRRARPTLVIASDGELYGHHQPFRDLFLQRLVAPDESTPRPRLRRRRRSRRRSREPDGRPHPEIRIRDRTSWSCHHGVLRWSGECPDVPDGRWKAPLRAALDRLAGGIDAVTEPLARDLPGPPDPWAARDALRGRGRRRRGRPRRSRPRAWPARRDGRRPRRLLAAARGAALAARDVRLVTAGSGTTRRAPETRQVLRSAARAARIVDGLAGTDLEARLVADLAILRSPALGIDGGDDLPPRAERGRPAAAAG